MSATTAPAPAPRDRLGFFCLNVGHFLDHLFTLIYATVVSLALVKEWKLSYAELVPLATFGFVAFGLYSLPAGRLADNWSRHGMMVVFFIGIGLASIATSFAANPQQIAVLLFVVGVLAAIYHPVGLAMVVESVKTQGAGAGGTSNTVIFVCLGVGLALLSAAYFMGAASPWLQRGMAAVGLLLRRLLQRLLQFRAEGPQLGVFGPHMFEFFPDVRPRRCIVVEAVPRLVPAVAAAPKLVRGGERSGHLLTPCSAAVLSAFWAKARGAVHANYSL